MTNERINAAIAEACGWTEIASDEWFVRAGIPPNLPSKRWPLPNYCECLNAMHEAEKILEDVDVYEWRLCQVCAGNEYLFHATARQRAEAFLRAIGKWEEVAK